uniref:Uncharacterized protein n=1 Tax=Rhizophora mucronata TaxID=61149 RepID=A0A2P2QB31_RHIMU
MARLAYKGKIVIWDCSSILFTCNLLHPCL